MTVKEILQELEPMGNEATRKHFRKAGAHDNMFGVKLGDLRKVAKKIKTNHELALQLWETENIDARLLACLIMKPEDLSTDQLDQLVKSIRFDRVADWVNSYVVKNHPDKESFRETWMNSDNPMAARAGWNLTCSRVVKSPDGLDMSALLDRIESEMGQKHPSAQWTMNFALAEIGINHPSHRERAVAIGEKLGLYRDYPTVKGCVSPFVPTWVNEMVSRQG